MKAISSKALEANIAEFNVEVTIDPRYHVIQDIMSAYDGLQKPLKTFLKELCHPRRNWMFIIDKARSFSLGYFYDLKTHKRGPDAFRLYVDISIEAINKARSHENKSGAFSNLYLLLQKFIKDGGEELERFLPVIDHAFHELENLSEDLFPVITKSYYQLNRLGLSFLEKAPEHADFRTFNDLLIKLLKYTYEYWLSENDPREWFESEISEPLIPEVVDLFKPISHVHIKECQTGLSLIIKGKNRAPREAMRELLELPGYGSIINYYDSLPEKIYDSAEGEKLKHQWKLTFLFHTMNIPGLSTIHEETLREINRDIAWLISHEDIDHIQSLIERTFSILSQAVDRYPDTALKAVLNMGEGVYETDESDLVHFFNERVVLLGFQTPDFRGISDDWQIQGNVAHIQNIRAWMELIKLNPKWSKKLLSSLIIHLSLSGVLIKDTDLFPRDVTGFLNSDIRPVFNLAKQLMRLFPTYFNEIGAEGELRDISTDIDELCKRKDVLVHFLRKQAHVESSNKIISLIEATLEFWRTKSKDALKPYIPSNIYEQVEAEGPYIDGINKVVKRVFESAGLTKITDLLSLGEDYVREVSGDVTEEDRIDIERVSLALSFYKLLNQKYCIGSCEIEDYIGQVRSTVPMDFKDLKDALSAQDTFEKIAGLLEILDQLKEIILSPEPFEIREDIYRKRHIAADIPSMYGSYREAKFDALGLTFRLEFIVNTLFEELTEDFDFDFITHHTFYEIYKYLKLFNHALKIDGIPATEFENQLELLRRSLNIKLFTFSQYLDIFRGFTQVVRNIVSDYFHNIHEENLLGISEYLPADKLLPKYLRESDNRKELFHKVSEIFLRDSIASSLGIQRLDLFLTRISNTLHEQAGDLPADKHYLLLTYDPRNVVTSFIDPDRNLVDIVHLGNKGLNMVKMKNLNLPVPYGFVVTTEVFRCRELIDSYPPANVNFRKQIDSEISRLEKVTGRHFGSPERPLLVSVRSGAAISQPGMMDSYLNVGINEDIVQGIISETNEAWFAWDCYRRFLQSFGMSFGLKRDEFDSIIDEFKKKCSVPLKKDFAPGQMKDVAMAYKEFIQSNGVNVRKSPREQLYIAIQRVLNSWNAPKAQAYRKIIGISDNWGTAVTVQTMVFGNISQQSGSGVYFTHSPKYSRDLLRPWGDYTVGNQGEDVVSGLVTTYPISVYQAKMESRAVESTLEKKFPDIYRALREIAKTMIYENQWAPQDIEFTFEGPREEDLYILQTRNMEMRVQKRCPSFESTAEMSEKFLGHGIGVSGGALSGRAVFSLDDIAHWKNTEPETPLILIRSDTVPDDIKEISAAEGLLTARGGATSHAAIVANRLEKTCVVGCKDLICMEKHKQFILNHKVMNVGEFISIDGTEGSIYSGKMKIKTVCD
jgi:pyruvate,orthophosphate dikinase